MVKAQAHEKFKTFTGAWEDRVESFTQFAADPNIQVKSISSSENTLSVGYVAGDKYPVHLEDRIIHAGDVDAELEALAKECTGDVICHSLYRRPNGTLACTFLVHRS